MALQLGDDLLRPDPGIGLVDRRHIDGDALPEHLASRGVDRESIERRQRVRRHDRAVPLNDVPVIVVMRRLDQDQLETWLDATGHVLRASSRSIGAPFRASPTGRPVCTGYSPSKRYQA